MSDDDDWQAYLKDSRRICKYGKKCYQKNSEHQEKFKHPPQLKNKTANKRKARFSPYARTKEGKNIDEEQGIKEKDSIPATSQDNVSTIQDSVLTNNTSDSTTLPDIKLDETTQYFDKDPDHKLYKECFLVDMPPDFFQFYKCLTGEGSSVEKLLASVNLQLIGPYDLLLGKLPIIDNKDLYLIHWRFFFDPPEFQAVLKKKGKSEYHIGYFRDSPDDSPVFLAANNSQKDYIIKPVATNIFGAVYWYLQEEKKTSPFVSVACQKLSEKINGWAKEHNYTLEEFNMKNRRLQTVCKSLHEAGIAVPYDKKTQLGYRSLAESDAKIKKMFKELQEAKTQSEKDAILSKIQPVITYANIAVDECDFGTGLEAGIALFCSGQKELEHSALTTLCAVYSLLNRDAFGQIIKVHLNYRRKGPDMAIWCK